MNPKYEDTDVCSECIDEIEEIAQVSLCVWDFPSYRYKQMYFLL